MATVEQVMKQKIRMLQKDLEDIARHDIPNLVDNELRNAIDDTVYSVPESDYYDRTYGLRNSVIAKTNKINNSSYEITGFVDANQMSYEPYTEHSSWVTGYDMRDLIDYWMNYGHHGIVDYTPAYFIQLAQKNVDMKVKKLINFKMSKKGYNIK